MARILKVIIILFVSFALVIAQPAKQASANPLAVGGALYLGGAGVYVLGAIAVGGLYGLAGCESCQADIEAHAQRTWDGTTQLAKDGLQAMIDASVGLGNVLTATDARFNTWVDSQIDQMVAEVTDTVTYGAITNNFYVTTSNDHYKNFNVKDTYRLRLGVGNSSDFGVIGVYIEHGGSDFIMRLDGGTSKTIVVRGVSAGQYAGIESYFKNISTPYQLLAFVNAYWALNHSDFGGPNKAILWSTDATWTTNYNAFASATKEIWEDMKDAGLVLPTDNARPVHNGQPVTYNPTNDTYAGIDGNVVNRDGITFEYPQPHWKTDDDLAALGIGGAGAGLYIDGWPETNTTSSTYNPTTDTTTTTTTGATTNVTTGATSTTTTTTTTTGDTTSNPPTESTNNPPVPKDRANRWGKLVTTKFPFSLPWDLFFILSFLNADPVTPVFKIDERINKRENVEGIQIKFDIDLSFLDDYIPWFRRFIILGFAFFLIMNTRKLLGGAQ